MKLKDIEVGKDYAVGSERYNDRMTALEVGVHGKVFDGWRSGPSVRADYVRLRRRDNREHVATCRQVLRPWAEQKTINAKRRRRREGREAELRRVRLLNDAAPDLLEALREIAAGGEAPFGTDMDYRSRDELAEIARAAIARAEGHHESEPDPPRE